MDNNGSSIISHGLDNTVYVQKFDPEGFRVWTNIVVAHDNDSSNFGGGSWIVPDGNGGAGLGWIDHRRSTWDPLFGYLDNAFYGQRVDRDGSVTWPSGGVLISPPDSGKKTGNIVSDGSGGLIYAGVERGFDSPLAPDRERLFAIRVDGSGSKVWDLTIKSSNLENKLFFRKILRAGKFIYIDYYDQASGLREDSTIVVDTTGAFGLNNPWQGFFSNVSWQDSVLFSLTFQDNIGEVRKLGMMGDTLWMTSFALSGNGCNGTLPFGFIVLVPDALGGVYYMYECQDTIYHFDNNGSVDRLRFSQIGSIGDYVTYSGDGVLVIANEEGIAQRWDFMGTSLWGDSAITFQSDPENSSFQDFWGDRNGGIITTFWSTSLGLSAQHTGRHGVPGIIVTSVSLDDNEIPAGWGLSQNYPNPFNPETRIRWKLSRRADVRIEILDILGRRVSTIVNQTLERGDHSVVWNMEEFSSGIYFYSLILDGRTVETRKMTLVR